MGRVPRDFLLQVFSWIIFPQAPEHNIRAISNFFENSLRYSKSRCTTGINNTGGKWEQHQTADSLKYCWQLEINLKEKNYLCFNSTTQRCPKKYLKFSEWRFFPFATGVNNTGGATWAVNISTNFRNGPNGILRGLGETDSCKKNLKSKISWYCIVIVAWSIVGLPYCLVVALASPACTHSARPGR